MNSYTIEQIMRRDEITKNIFLGVYPRDKIPRIKKVPSCLILNTDPSSTGGEHWLAMYVDKNNHCEFFDSYGNHPRQFNLEVYLNKEFNSWDWSTPNIQGVSNFCGYYCILFIMYNSRNKLKQFYDEFKKNPLTNDKKLLNLINDLE